MHVFSGAQCCDFTGLIRIIGHQLKESPTDCFCSKKDLIPRRRGSRQCFRLLRMHNSAGRQRAARKGPGPLAACGPRWMSPRSFQVPWLVLDLQDGKNLNPPNVFCPSRQNSFQLQCIFLLTKLVSYIAIYTGFIENGSQTYKVFFAVVNCDGLKRGLRWGSET